MVMPMEMPMPMEMLMLMLMPMVMLMSMCCRQFAVKCGRMQQTGMLAFAGITFSQSDSLLRARAAEAYLD